MSHPKWLNRFFWMKELVKVESFLNFLSNKNQKDADNGKQAFEPKTQAIK